MLRNASLASTASRSSPFLQSYNDPEPLLPCFFHNTFHNKPLHPDSIAAVSPASQIDVPCFMRTFADPHIAYPFVWEPSQERLYFFPFLPISHFRSPHVNALAQTNSATKNYHQSPSPSGQIPSSSYTGMTRACLLNRKKLGSVSPRTWQSKWTSGRSDWNRSSTASRFFRD
jgi:hypothetical protein